MVTMRTKRIPVVYDGDWNQWALIENENKRVLCHCAVERHFELPEGLRRMDVMIRHRRRGDKRPPQAMKVRRSKYGNAWIESEDGDMVITELLWEGRQILRQLPVGEYWVWLEYEE
jgi:hypothetical protein